MAGGFGRDPEFAKVMALPKKAILAGNIWASGRSAQKILSSPSNLPHSAGVSCVKSVDI